MNYKMRYECPHCNASEEIPVNDFEKNPITPFCPNCEGIRMSYKRVVSDPLPIRFFPVMCDDLTDKQWAFFMFQFSEKIDGPTVGRLGTVHFSDGYNILLDDDAWAILEQWKPEWKKLVDNL